MGVLNMEKDTQNLKNEYSNLTLKKKAKEEILEISPTGYGLESVIKESSETEKQ
jgi:hypothetical protein